MPARRSSPRPPKAADANGDLAALGFRVADSGPHTSKTLMLQELETLLAVVPAEAPAKAYRAAVVEENVLGKRTLSTRKEPPPGSPPCTASIPANPCSGCCGGYGMWMPRRTPNWLCLTAWPATLC